MRQFLPFLASLLLLFACEKEEKNTPQPEDPNWYVLRAPDNREIKAVHGNIDDTLVITTGFKIYVTTDQGKTWQTGSYNAGIGLFAFIKSEDTLFAMEGQRGSFTTRDNAFGIQPYWCSLDNGLTWSRARGSMAKDGWQVPINYAYSGNGIKFGIDMIQTPEGYLRTIGIKSESGTRLTLPGNHQLISIYFDHTSRLYVTGSAPLCGQGNTFEYCDDKTRNGTLFVSRKPVLY